MMKNFFISLSVFFFLIIGNIAQAQDSGSLSLTIRTEGALTLPMAEILRDYSSREQVTLLIMFGDGPSHVQRLLEGDDGDVIITAMPTVINDIKQRGLMDIYTPTIVASNSLVLAGKAGFNASKQTVLDRLNRGSALLLADPERYIEGEAGRTAAAALDHGQAGPLPVEIMPNSSAQIEALQTRVALGIVLNTEALQNPELNIQLPLEQESYPPIRYQAAVIAGEHMPAARKFVEYLKGDIARKIFARYGFTAPDA